MLRELEDQFAVSGMEDSMHAFLQEKLSGMCDSVEIDKMGNLHAFLRGRGPEFLIVAYMDEPGVILTQITEEGYLRFETVGRINPAFLVSKRVSLGNYTGIISLKAIHLTTKEEREIPVKTSQLLIDIGATSKEEASQMVEIGDYGVLDIPYQELNNGYVKGRSIAGRMGCFAAMEVLKQNTDSNIHVIFAVQREVGGRGILGCGRTLQSNYTIVFDGISAKTYMEPESHSPEVGEGVVLVTQHPGGMIDAGVLECCKNIAKEEAVSLQFDIMPNNIGISALLKTGTHNIVALAIPVRYADSVSPVANTNDMDAMIQITNRFIERKTKKEEI